MKKYLLTIMMVCLACVSAMAADCKVVSGNKKVWKGATGEALLNINWSEAQYDYKMPLTDKFANLEPFAEASWSGFVQEFNEECKVQVVKESKSAKYQIDIKVTNVDQYVKITGFIPGPATKIWGTLTVTDIATGQILVTVAINSLDGGASPSPFESFSDSFEKLGEWVADLD